MQGPSLYMMLVMVMVMVMMMTTIIRVRLHLFCRYKQLMAQVPASMLILEMYQTRAAGGTS